MRGCTEPDTAGLEGHETEVHGGRDERDLEGERGGIGSNANEPTVFVGREHQVDALGPEQRTQVRGPRGVGALERHGKVVEDSAVVAKRVDAAREVYREAHVGERERELAYHQRTEGEGALEFDRETSLDDDQAKPRPAIIAVTGLTAAPGLAQERGCA